MGIFDVESEDVLTPEHLRKVVVFVGVVVFHGIVFVAITKTSPPSTKTEAGFVSTFFLIEPRKRKEEEPAAKATRARSTRSTPESVDTRIDKAIESQPTTSISVPPTDWAAERERVAERQVSKEAADAAKRSLFARPNVIELPKGEKVHEAGDTQRFDDGEMITWIDDRCYVSNREPVTPRLDPNAIIIQCKGKGRPPIVDGFDHVKPKYLRKEGEPPAKPKSLFSGETITCDYSSTVCDN